MMEAKCPKCGSDDFDIYDQDVILLQNFIRYECECIECNTLFIIDIEPIIKSIR